MMLVLQAAASLAAVLALIALVGLAARARLQAARLGVGPGNGLGSSPGNGLGSRPGALRLCATLAIDSRRRLHLVQTEHGQVLILTGGPTDQMAACPHA
jgi:hypothetical protein